MFVMALKRVPHAILSQYGGDRRVRVSLAVTFRNFPAIHTNHIISHCTTLQYNHNI